MGSMSGQYTSERDGGIKYTYYASWEKKQDAIIWSAKVRRDGSLAGTPGGQILNADQIDMESAVRRLVETSIEERLGVQ